MKIDYLDKEFVLNPLKFNIAQNQPPEVFYKKMCS